MKAVVSRAVGSATQEVIVLAIAAAMFVIFAATLPRFASVDNLLALLRNVSILGILSAGMAMTVLGRGIDLSIVANMATSVAWLLLMLASGMNPVLALLIALTFCMLIGIANGLLIAYVEIPAVFTTLAMGGLVYGFGRFALISVDVVNVPAGQDWLRAFGGGTVAGVPAPVVIFVMICALVALFLNYVKAGKLALLQIFLMVAKRISCASFTRVWR